MNKRKEIKKTKKSGQTIQIFILFIIILAIFALWYKYARNTTFQKIQDAFQSVIESKKHPVPTKAPFPTPITYQLPEGKQVYTFSHGSRVVGPKIQQAIIDPLTPKKNEKQTVTITIKNNSPVTDAFAVLFTDDQHITYKFKLINGSATDGTWESSWTATDSYNFTYHLNFLLKSSTGNWTGALTFR